LAGVDIAAHANQPKKLVREVRDWLQAQLNQEVASRRARREILPDGDVIFGRFREFVKDLPTLCHDNRLNHRRLKFSDYVPLLEEWLEAIVLFHTAHMIEAPTDQRRQKRSLGRIQQEARGSAGLKHLTRRLSPQICCHDITEPLATTCRSASIVLRACWLMAPAEVYRPWLPHDWSRSLHHGLKKARTESVQSTVEKRRNRRQPSTFPPPYPAAPIERALFALGVFVVK
jgi:hypothetical protein